MQFIFKHSCSFLFFFSPVLFYHQLLWLKIYLIPDIFVLMPIDLPFKTKGWMLCNLINIH